MLGYAQRADVIAACGVFRRVEVTAQSDLPGSAGHVPGTHVERNQRCEASLARRQIDAARIGTKQQFAILPENRAFPGKKQNCGDAAYLNGRDRVRHDELVAALNASPNATGGTKGIGNRRTVSLARRHHGSLEMANHRPATLIPISRSDAHKERKNTNANQPG